MDCEKFVPNLKAKLNWWDSEIKIIQKKFCQDDIVVEFKIPLLSEIEE
jgi:hypothetical protein